jgi:hypothetical protein
MSSEDISRKATLSKTLLSFNRNLERQIFHDDCHDAAIAKCLEKATRQDFLPRLSSPNRVVPELSNPVDIFMDTSNDTFLITADISVDQSTSLAAWDTVVVNAA